MCGRFHFHHGEQRRSYTQHSRRESDCRPRPKKSSPGHAPPSSSAVECGKARHCKALLIAYPTVPLPQKRKPRFFLANSKKSVPNFSSGIPPPPRRRSAEHATEIGGRLQRDWRRSRGGGYMRQGRRRRRRRAEEGLYEPARPEAEERAV